MKLIYQTAEWVVSRAVYFLLHLELGCIALVVSKFVSLLIRMVVARVGVAETGTFYLAMYILKFVILVSMLGFEGYIVRDIAAAHAKGDKGMQRHIMNYSLSIVVPFSIFTSFVLWYTSDLIVEWFHDPTLLIPLYIIAGFLPLVIVSGIAPLYFRGVGNLKAYMVFAWFGKVALRFIATLVAFIWFGTINSILFAALLGTLLLTWPSFHYMFKEIGVAKTSAKWERPLGFVLPLYGATLAYAAFEWVDSFMIGHYLSIESVGIYDTAFSVAWLLLMVPTATLTFFMPRVIDHFEKKKPFKPLYDWALSWNFALNGAIALGLLFFGEYILHYLFGSEFTQGYPLMFTLSVGFWFSHSLMSAKSFLFVKKRSITLFILSLGSLAINILLNRILIPIYQLPGAALATTISFSILTLSFVIVTYLDFKLTPFSPTLIFSFVCFLVTLSAWNALPKSLPISITLLILYLGGHALTPMWRNEVINLRKILQ